MDPNSGRIYEQQEYEALPPERQGELVQIIGTPEQVEKISRSIRNDNRRRNKAARKARRITRRTA
jgi:hypothetical protein